MSATLVHDMDTVWVSSSPALSVSADPDFAVEGNASNRLTSAGVPGATASFLPAGPIDLSNADELRFWVRADQRANGSTAAPFYMEFSFTDTNDLPTDEHRWLVPVGRENVWEQRRIGVDNDRRASVNRFRFRSLTNAAFIMYR